MAFTSGIPAASPLPLLPGVVPGATIMFVHAHPDDETIVTGATIAACATAGADVVLVTCTRGELGEVIPPDLAHLEVRQSGLEADDAGHLPEGEPGPGAGLARERERELAAALAALGVQQHIWLGQGLTAPVSGPAVFRDSGMAWGPDGRAMAAATVLPGSFSRAPLVPTAALLAQAIRVLRPAVLVTYAADGGYGHPDHVRTHQVAMAALDLAAQDSTGQVLAAQGGESASVAGASGAVPGWSVPSVYAIVSDRPERPLEDGAPRLAVAGDLAAKIAAMAAHRTQITVSGERFALSDNVWRDINAVEEFVSLVPAQGQAGRGGRHSAGQGTP